MKMMEFQLQRRAMKMSNARRVIPKIKFNGKDVSETMQKYLEEISYDDIASGSSDTLSIKFYDRDLKWLGKWMPKKGDRIIASLTFKDWNKEGEKKTLSCGDFLLDEMSACGNPLNVTIGGIALPTNSKIKSTARHKTWKKVTTKQIASEISGKYGLSLVYDAPVYTIASLEQSDKSDSSFLYDLCKDYGFGMKIYRKKLVIYGKSKYEKKKATMTISRKDFVENDWNFNDTLEKTYTGARTSYKSGKDNKEINVYVGIKGENARGARTLRINVQSSSEHDARVKAAAAVNLENEKATTLNGKIFAKPGLVAGICVTVKDFGKGDGKYFVDEVKTSYSGESGTTQEISLHRCQKQVTA